MSAPSSAPRPGEIEAIEATAAVWLSLRDRGMSEEETAEFMRWLQQDPRHAEVFGELDRVWRQFNQAQGLRPREAAPRADLLAPRARSRRRLAVALAAAAAVALAFVGTARLTLDRPTAQTTVGAFRSLDLPDGSLVRLNTDSAVKVAYTDGERRVELVRGEAHFDVAKNPLRPFVVTAGPVAVRAVGTAFNVRRRTEQVEVLVTEGRVQVLDSRTETPALAPPPPLLGRGEQAVIPLQAETAAPPPVVVRALAEPELERVMAWQDRRLEFEDEELEAVVAEFNRYNRAQLVIADPALRSRRFSGAFRSDGFEAFVRLLEENFRVRVERDGDRLLLHGQ